MAGYANENRIELISDRYKFKHYTGMILDFREIQWLGLTLDNTVGMFCDERINTLLRFVEVNRDYHIVTSDSAYRWINRYIPGYDVYYLAEGNKNPYLVLHTNLEIEREQNIRRLRMMRLRELASRSSE
jgi:hypothetical protein